MKKPKLNERTITRLVIYGQAQYSKYCYELKDFMDAEGNRYTVLERTNIRTGKTDAFEWKGYIKEA